MEERGSGHAERDGFRGRDSQRAARMARDLHNTLAQGFTGVIMQMEAAEEALLEANSKQPD
jgi:signal transduction histidine kinase